MPDEVLISMEDEIISRYVDRLKSSLSQDPYLDGPATSRAMELVDEARGSYEHLYEKK